MSTELLAPSPAQIKAMQEAWWGSKCAHVMSNAAAIAVYRAALAAAPAEPVAAPYWMIERGQAQSQHPTVWLGERGEWVENSARALKWPNRDDAAHHALQFRPRSYAVTEHIDMPAHAAPQPQQAGVEDEAELRRLLAEERETTRQLVRALRDAIEEPVFMGEPIRTSAPPPQAPAPAAQAQAVSQWQGIESAPKDGKDLLIHTKDGLTRLAFFDRARGGVWSCWPGRENMQATHWMPLPEAPGSAAQKKST